MFYGEYDYETDIKVQREEAREEGITQGISEGVELTIRQMLASGMSTAQVAQITGKSETDLEDLLNKTVSQK